MEVMTLDVRALSCPLPVLKLRRALAFMVAGEQIRVLVMGADAARDITALCEATGDRICHSEPVGTALMFVIERHG